METFNAWDGEGNELLAGYQHHSVREVAERVHRPGRVVELVGSLSGTWIVGPRGGLRRQTKTEKKAGA